MIQGHPLLPAGPRQAPVFGLSGRRSIPLNYPHWLLAMPGGLLIALIAVPHVFVSHFAVGGGFFLVSTEARARKQNDAALLAYCKRHSKFFALLTLVFGAIT